MSDGGNSANGISVTEFLDEGAAYWQNGEQLYGLGIRWEIEGDVAVKAVCEHENAAYSAGSTTDTHRITCSDCGKNAEEAHAIDNKTGKCACGMEMAVVKMTAGTEVTYYDTLASAIKAADGKNAVLDLMDNVVLDGFLYNDKENTQLVLNLSEKTITLKGSGELELRKGAKMTINGDGKVTYAEGYTQPAFISLTKAVHLQ